MRLSLLTSAPVAEAPSETTETQPEDATTQTQDEELPSSEGTEREGQLEQEPEVDAAEAARLAEIEAKAVEIAETRAAETARRMAEEAKASQQRNLAKQIDDWQAAPLPLTRASLIGLHDDFGNPKLTAAEVDAVMSGIVGAGNGMVAAAHAHANIATVDGTNAVVRELAGEEGLKEFIEATWEPMSTADYYKKFAEIVAPHVSSLKKLSLDDAMKMSPALKRDHTKAVADAEKKGYDRGLLGPAGSGPSYTGGASVPNKVTYQQILKMSKAEIDKLPSEVFDAAVNGDS